MEKKTFKDLGIIGFVVAQAIGIIGWAARIDSTVFHHERYVEEIPKIAEQIRTISNEINKIKEKLYGRKACGNTYGTRFKRAVNRVLENEGGYSNDPNDLGGETKYGISKRSYPNLDIRNLTLEGAKLIYYRDFWASQLYEQINSFKIAEKIFDLAVNVGTNKAHVILQRALRAVGNTVKEDGILEKTTLAAVNSANEESLLAAIKSEAAGYYRSNVAKNSSQNKFINGWLNRSYT